MTHPMVFVGIDISKNKHDVAMVDAQKNLLAKLFVIAESRAGYAQLQAALMSCQQRYQTREFRIGMEATGDYWKNLYHFLKGASPAFVLTVLNPVQTNRFAQSELRRAKTDPVNAFDIARFMAEKQPQPSHERLPIFECLKELDRHLHALTKQNAMTLNQLRIELGKVAPEIEQAFSRFDGPQLLAVLKQYPTAEIITRTAAEELCVLRYGPKSRRLSQALVAKIKALAEKSCAHKTGLGAEILVQTLVERVQHTQQLRARLKQHLVELYQQARQVPSVLTTIKGITPETAMLLEAYISDVQRFPSAKQIVAFFGMNPTVNLSGKATKRASYLEKKGNGLVRHKLFMITLNLIRHRVEPFYGFYSHLVAAGKPKLVAVLATARKLLVIIYTLLKKQQPFNPNKK